MFSSHLSYAYMGKGQVQISKSFRHGLSFAL